MVQNRIKNWNIFISVLYFLSLGFHNSQKKFINLRFRIPNCLAVHMFTPQRSAWSLKSKVSSEKPRSKGKGITGNLDSAATPLPPLSLLNGGDIDRGGEDMEAWKRFKDEGLLDESTFHKKDRESLASRIIELEKDVRI